MARGISRQCLVFLFCASVFISTAAQNVRPDLFDGLKWRLIGPFRGGRVVAVAGIPGNSTTFYFGAVNGGIWETTNAGVVWRPIFDAQHISSIGTLAVSPSDPKVIYAGTGESDIRSDLSSGDGVYKSTDAGATWTNIGLRDTRQISRIVIDPRDANVVYVAALGHAYGPNDERGIFKSSDGGAHWTNVLNAGPDIGAADLAIATVSPNILFATTWNAHRPPWSTYAPLGGSGSGLYRSLDSGQSWQRLTGNGLPAGDWGRTGVAVSPDGKRVYALIGAKDGGKEGPGLFRSDDGGQTWSLANSDSRLTSRSWYFGSITIDPNNPDVIYIPNVALYRSADGGKSVSIVRGAPGGDDYHQIWIDPADSTRMVLGTDQGTTISVDYGETWTSWYNQPTAQIYRLATDDKFPYNIYGTQQDSGGIALPSRTDHGQITARDWFSPGGSESGSIAPDPNDPNILYLTGSYGSVSRFDRRTSFSQDVSPWPIQTWNTEIYERKYRAPWTPVLLFSPVDKKTLYLGTQFVMRTNDGGLHWETISPDLTGAANLAQAKKVGETSVANAKENGYGVISSIAPSSLDGNLIWAGSDTGIIHLTRDGGKTWKDVTPKGLSDWSRISHIESSRFDPAEAYAAIERHRLDDLKPYLYRTRDFGATWRPITEGIPDRSFLRVVRQDPQAKGLLFAGTELGISVSFDDGDHWQPLQLNLPATSVTDIAVHGDDLVIATHGRSFWILDDISVLRQFKSASDAQGNWLYAPATAIRIDNDSFLGTPLPPEEPTAANPPSGAVLDYYLKSHAQHVQLEIFDGQGSLVRAFSSDDHNEPKRRKVAIAERWFPQAPMLELKPGMHRFVWDLRCCEKDAGTGDSGDEEYGAPRAPRVPPGAYNVKLTVDGNTRTQPLKVIMDPRSAATTKDLQQQYQLGRQMFSEVVAVNRTLAAIHRAQTQLVSLIARTGAQQADLNSLLTRARDQINDVVTGNPSLGTQAMGLDAASKNIASAARVVESGDRTSPSQAIEVYEEADRAVKLRMAEWSSIKTHQLPTLNDQLKRANEGPITVGED
jgi:photosystem II stability/assembly factor-like uncharacterized protein